MEEFEAQKESYKESVLPSSVRARVAVEAGSSLSWGKYVGLDGMTVCKDDFGASAPPRCCSKSTASQPRTSRRRH